MEGFIDLQLLKWTVSNKKLSSLQTLSACRIASYLSVRYGSDKMHNSIISTIAWIPLAVGCNFTVRQLVLTTAINTGNSCAQIEARAHVLCPIPTSLFRDQLLWLPLRIIEISIN